MSELLLSAALTSSVSGETKAGVAVALYLCLTPNCFHHPYTAVGERISRPLGRYAMSLTSSEKCVRNGMSST